MPKINIINSLNEIPSKPEWSRASKFKCEGRVVNNKGECSSISEGRSYKVIAKMERSLSGGEKFVKRFLGTIIVISSLGLALMLKSVYRLFNSKISKRYAIVHNPKPSNLVKPSLPINTSSYEDLRKKMEKKDTSVYLENGTDKQPENFLEVLGQGGCKKAIKISGDRVLILPNMDADSVSDVSQRWERIVLEEVAMSKALTSIGLLSPLLKQVNVSLNENSEDVIPAYTSETFESLTNTRGWYIIDHKNLNNSQWGKLEKRFFNSEKERLNEKNWKPIIDSMLTDIAKICTYDIPIPSDSLNVAIMKNPRNSQDGESEYEIRYFGFDFTSKSTPLSIPKLDKKNLSSDHRKKVEYLLFSLLENVFFHEFDEKICLKNDVIKFLDKLVMQYTNEVLSRIRE